MRNHTAFIIAVSLLFLHSSVKAQGSEDAQFLLRKTNSFNFLIHTRGLGVGYQQGVVQNIYNTMFWQGEIVTMRHSKEYKRTNEAFPNSYPYSYGKLNMLFMVRGGVGFQRLLTDKPYWGGVSTSYSLSFGGNLAVAKPIYLYILHYDNIESVFYKVLEKYDPEKHFSDNIFGRGPIGTGMREVKVFPGGFFKGAIQFEYGEKQEYVRALEIGAAVDLFAQRLPIMAHIKNANMYVTLSLALKIGKRK